MEENTSEHRAFAEGSLIDSRYEVLSSVGLGNIGVVYRVADRTLNGKVVALKVICPQIVQNETLFARLRHEVQIVRKLGHPNVVALYDFCSAQTPLPHISYITMEYVAGESLAKRLQQGTLNFLDAQRILFEICQGLSAAHCQGIVHHDLRPEHVLLNENGLVKITDFFSACLLETEKGFASGGAQVGAPFYLAPEQFRGEQADQRSDIYALGIIAYEMVTGKKPFAVESFIELAQKHLHELLPPVVGHESMVPDWFGAFVEKCTAKDPRQRYQSVDEILTVFSKGKEEELAGSPQETPPMLSLPQGPCSKSSSYIVSFPAYVLGALASLMLLIGGFWVVWGSRSGPGGGSAVAAGQEQPQNPEESQPIRQETTEALIGPAAGNTEEPAVKEETKLEDKSKPVQQPAATPVKSSLPPVVRYTRLRAAMPEGVWHYGKGLKLKSVSVSVQNSGGEPAKDIKVTAVIPGGKKVPLQGPGELKAHGKAEYQELDLQESIKIQGKIKINVTCSNCYH
jgi:serine/threonine protein kinase